MRKIDADPTTIRHEVETTVKVVFYSMYGHTHRMAEEVARGVDQVPGAAAELLQVPELVPDEVLEESGARETKDAFADVPVAGPRDLAEADAIVFGTPTRFGNMAAQLRNFLDQTGGLWAGNELVGKVGAVSTSANTQHGGHESTLLSTQITLQHHGMIVVGVPYSEDRPLPGPPRRRDRPAAEAGPPPGDRGGATPVADVGRLRRTASWVEATRALTRQSYSISLM